MGQTALLIYFLSEGRHAEDFFFALKNPTALAGFEPRNLGTKGQHATSRPSKPLRGEVTDPCLVPKSGTDGAVPAFLYVVSWRRQIQF